MVECPVYDRYRLGGRVRGPAVIEEAESTVVVGPGAAMAIDGHGNLVVERRATASRRQRPSRRRTETPA